MKWALKIGEVAGIGIFVHWTFALFIGWIFYSDLSRGDTVRAALEGIGFILAIFACIVLHELGHALTALQFGIRTRDITLLPIGGVARLERIPDKPMQEFLVAIAGPAVNVVIAIVLMVVVTGMVSVHEMLDWNVMGASFLLRLLLVNIGLVIFNMIPAFPMDGGRVLRSLLSPMMGHLRATDTAASVGQIIAILFGILGLFGNGTGMLIFIAIFIFLGAQQEVQMAHVNSILHGVPVRNAMMTSFRAFSPHDLLDSSVSHLLAGSQKDFPVLDESELVGMLRGKTLIEISTGGNLPIPVTDVMQRDFKVIEDTAMLQEAFEQMQFDSCFTLPVVQKGKFVGIVSLEDIGAWLMTQAERNSGGASIRT